MFGRATTRRRCLYGVIARTLELKLHYFVQQIHPQQIEVMECGLSMHVDHVHSCNAVLHIAPIGIIQKVLRVQNNVSRILLQAVRRQSVTVLTSLIPSSVTGYTHTQRSASSTSLNVRRTRLSTVGDRAIPVAAACLWNSLPSHVTAPSLSIFCCRLKSLLTFVSRFLPLLSFVQFPRTDSSFGTL